MYRPPSAVMPAARLVALLLAGCLGLPAAAQAPAAAPKPSTDASRAGAAPAIDAHRRDDIAKHRVISAAHAAAASCLEAGRKESECQDALRKACEGVAVGRYCGMKHSH